MNQQQRRKISVSDLVLAEERERRRIAIGLHDLRVPEADELQGPPDRTGVNRLPEPVQQERRELGRKAPAWNPAAADTSAENEDDDTAIPADS